MPPIGLHIYRWPQMNLTFDLLVPKVDPFMSLPHRQLKLCHRLIRVQNTVFTSLAINGRCERIEVRTGGHSGVFRISVRMERGAVGVEGWSVV